MVAHVVLQNDSRALDRCFSYAVPAEFVSRVRVGMQVSVPFGAGNRSASGVILALTDETDDTLKQLIDADATAVSCPTFLLPLAEYLRDETFCTYQDAFRVLMPPGSRRNVVEFLSLVPDCSDDKIQTAVGRSGIAKRIVHTLRDYGTLEYSRLCTALSSKNLRPQLNKLLDAGVVSSVRKEETAVHEKKEKVVSLTLPAETALEKLSAFRSAPAQEKQLRYLIEKGQVPMTELVSQTKTSRSATDGLVQKGLAVVEERSIERIPTALNGHCRTAPFRPTEEQAEAIAYLKAEVEKEAFSKALLFGVTGSGKTEVFLQAIEYVISMGKQAIVLVPEISLTPQMVERFVGRFGERVAVLHSVLSQGERFDQWNRIANGEVDVVVGARSAIFAPCKNLGLIVIDEEHEPTYKSENSPRYHARDVAYKRGELQHCPVLLSSATPSVESFYAAKEGECALLRLTARSNAAKMPEIILADMRKELMEGNRSVFSRALADALEQNALAQKQSVLFLNKRGYSSFVSCRNCGEVIKCPHCSVSLTFHAQDNEMVCHYCDYRCDLPSLCPSCKSTYIKPFGTGTQKVEQLLKERYPDLRVSRMDADTTGGKLSHQKILSDFSQKKTDVLLGTQMIAKGLDFPDVTLVGVLAADLSLHVDDYRSRERTFQLLTQVCGRSGRGETPGKAVVQTYSPDDETIGFVKRQDYLGFFESELALRRMLSLPPFSQFVLIQISSDNEADGKAVLDKWSRALAVVQQRGELSGTKNKILSCGESPIAKIGGKYRFRILLKTTDLTETRAVLHRLYEAYLAKRRSSHEIVTIDCNPNSIL